MRRKIILTLIIILIIMSSGYFGYSIYRNIGHVDNKMEKVGKDNYYLQYDDTWKIEKKEDTEIDFVHKNSGSKLKIRINQLENETQYKSIDELFDSFLYNIQNQNKTYNLVYKEKSKFQNQNLDGYKLLFETDENQVEICLYKKGDKLIIFTYEATSEYFDILLDSATNIIDNFNYKDKQFDVKTSISLKTESIKYTKQEEINSMLNDVSSYEIAASNYLVDYSIPSCFKQTNFDTTYGSYSLENLSNYSTITINTSILTRNLYEYIEKDSSKSIYEKYSVDYYDLEYEAIDKLSDDPPTYVYKNSYYKNDSAYENISIIYELNKNHIFIVDISSSDIGIPEELVKMIKINKTMNIAENIKNEKKDGLLIGTLKDFVDYSYSDIQEVTLKIPDGYHEVDKGINLYEQRNYESNEKYKDDIPKVEVEYKYTTLDAESILNSLNNLIDKDLGEFKDFSTPTEMNVGDRKYNVFERGYTRQSDTTDETGQRYKYYTKEKVLCCELPNNLNLFIRIAVNGNDVSNELINSFLNFEINK